MTNILLRRPRLGRATKHVVAQSEMVDRVVRNDRRIPPNLTTVIRWGTTSNINCRNVINTAEAIHLVNDKTRFREVMMEHQEQTGQELCPHTWIGDGSKVAIEDFMRQGGPVVVRPRKHAQGKQLYVCRNRGQLDVATRRCGEGWYASELIDKVSEYRIMFAQGRVVWVAKKTPGNPDEVAWNVARGGRFDNVRFDDWPLKAIRISREAFQLTGLDFGAVDVMLDRDGKVYVLEINSAPSQTSPYRQECTAKMFDYVLREGKGDLPIIEARGDWKKFVHPAISDRAIMVA